MNEQMKSMNKQQYTRVLAELGKQDGWHCREGFRNVGTPGNFKKKSLNVT